jgi:AraC family transcriptional regulator
MALRPAGAEGREMTNAAEPTRHGLRRFLQQHEGTSMDRLHFEDARLWDIATRLKAWVEAHDAADPRYSESLGSALAHEIVRLRSGETRAAPPVRGGLAGWQQRTVANYIEEHVAEQISLATLAGLARLSRYHFSRAFKQTFGMPPHRFHAHRRIERAKSLLADREASVTSVGMAVGFCETSSFSSAFRKITGVTPSGFQRSLASPPRIAA